MGKTDKARFALRLISPSMHRQGIAERAYVNPYLSVEVLLQLDALNDDPLDSRAEWLLHQDPEISLTLYVTDAKLWNGDDSQ